MLTRKTKKMEIVNVQFQQVFPPYYQPKISELRVTLNKSFLQQAIGTVSSSFVMIRLFILRTSICLYINLKTAVPRLVKSHHKRITLRITGELQWHSRYWKTSLFSFTFKCSLFIEMQVIQKQHGYCFFLLERKSFIYASCNLI